MKLPKEESVLIVVRTHTQVFMHFTFEKYSPKIEIYENTVNTHKYKIMVDEILSLHCIPFYFHIQNSYNYYGKYSEIIFECNKNILTKLRKPNVVEIALNYVRTHIRSVQRRKKTTEDEEIEREREREPWREHSYIYMI